MDKLYIIIPAYRNRKSTKDCLNAIEASSTNSDLNVIVVDHSRRHEICGTLKKFFPKVIWIKGDPSLWWTGATNMGIRMAMRRGATAVMLLNNDCFVTTTTIEKLLICAKEKRDAIFAPIQKDIITEEILYLAPTHCFLFGFPTLRGPTKLPKAKAKKRILPTKIIIGGRGVLIPRAVFNKVGLFDEKEFPHYGADHDFYLRCRKHKVKLFSVIDAVVYIDNHTTSIAVDPGRLSFSQFLYTLISKRSHRNIKTLVTLFRKYYPIKGFHYFGVFLNLTRYFFLYLWRKTKYLFKKIINF